MIRKLMNKNQELENKSELDSSVNISDTAASSGTTPETAAPSGNISDKVASSGTTPETAAPSVNANNKFLEIFTQNSFTQKFKKIFGSSSDFNSNHLTSNLTKVTNVTKKPISSFIGIFLLVVIGGVMRFGSNLSSAKSKFAEIKKEKVETADMSDLEFILLRAQQNEANKKEFIESFNNILSSQKETSSLDAESVVEVKSLFDKSFKSLKEYLNLIIKASYIEFSDPIDNRKVIPNNKFNHLMELAYVDEKVFINLSNLLNSENISIKDLSKVLSDFKELDSNLLNL